ncbi:MAG: hypothetical protein HBSAPP03_09070 [Phycisphaerae bacterium]|nr:MAG: hypothetical protein HBSAPP03_09070 [Phycisphaerae bacterium]
MNLGVAIPGIRRWTARALVALAAMLVLVLVVGIAASDRWHATQYVAWTPQWGVMFALAACVAGAGVMATGRSGRARRVAWTLAGAMVAWVLAVEWRWYRAVLPGPGRESAVRVLVWNPAWEKMSVFHERVLEARPDVFLCANPHPNADWVKLREGFGAPTYTLRQGTLVVVSRYPIRRFAWVPLAIAPEPNRPSWWPVPKTSAGGGEALCVVLDVPGFEGGMVVWLVDLPSDSWAWRGRVMADAAAAIQGFRGPFMTRDDGGRDVPEDALRLGQLLPHGGFEARPDAEPARGFPAPDLLAGDLNTPAGCWSVSRLAPGLRDAFADAGLGPRGTFPRKWPLLAIDQALLGPRVKAVAYDAVDLGPAQHLAQVIEVRHDAR